MAHRRPTGLILSPTYPVLAQDDPINLGLVGAWNFGEGGGAIARDLTGRTNGTVSAYSTAQWVPGPKQIGGKALAFNGTSQYVTVTTPIFSAIPAFSFSGWIYQPSRAGAWTPWFNTTDLISGLFIGKFTDAAALIYIGGTSASSTFPAYPTDTWFHLAVSVKYFSPSATVVTGWINGITTGSVGGGVMPSETAFEIAANTANSYYSNCTLANFRIWNRAILPTEVKRLYATPLAGFVPPKRITARAGTSGAFTGTLGDTVATSDAYTPSTFAATGSLTNTTTTSEAYTPSTFAPTGTLSDTVATSDSYAATIPAKSLSDTVSTSDAYTPATFAPTGTLGDSVATSDSYTATIPAKSLGDTVATSDAYTPATFQPTGTLGDTVATSDAYTTGLTAALSDTVSTSDAYTPATFAPTATLGDTVATSDAYTTPSLTGSLADTVATSDAYTRGTFAPTGTLSDTTATSSAYTSAGAATGALTDSVATSDAYNVTGSGRALSDTTAATDVYTSLANLFASLSDTVATSDSYTIPGVQQQLSDTVATSDHYAVAGAFSATLSDTISTSDEYDKVFLPIGHLIYGRPAYRFSYPTNNPPKV